MALSGRQPRLGLVDGDEGMQGRIAPADSPEQRLDGIDR